MKILSTLFLNTFFALTCLSGFGYAQSSSEYHKEIKKHRKKIEKEFKSPRYSPIKDAKARKEFHGNEYYPVNEAYKVMAKVELTPDAEPFKMNTSSGKQKTFRKWAIIRFQLEGKDLELSLYQNLKLMEQAKYKNYLFLPFKDHTNGEETYGGGRYIELDFNAGEAWKAENNTNNAPERTLEIDFNKCFNPYCAYSDGWNCPIVPTENYLEMKVEAGVKGWLDH